MDIDCSNDIQHYKDKNVHLIVAPRYYFTPDIGFWYLTDVGDHIAELLINDGAKYIGIYMYHTEDGDDQANISKILEYMVKYGEDNKEPVFTFAQCLTCNKVGSVGYIKNFNNIEMFSSDCTRKCDNCYDT